MADYYRQFSFLLPCTPEIAAQFIAAYEEERESESNLLSLDDFDSYYEGVEYSLDDSVWVDGGVWVTDSAGYGNLHAAEHITREFLIFTNNEDTVVQISWADTCSKPRLDGFGGGAILVSAQKTYSLDLYDELHHMAEQDDIKTFI